MNVKQADKSSAFDIVKFSFVALLIIGGFVANYLFAQEPWPIRAAGWLVLCCIVIVFVLQTARGRQLWRFFKDSRAEMRKIVWPARQHTFQMTLMVILIVIVVALLIWGFDIVLMWAVKWLTGQGG